MPNSKHLEYVPIFGLHIVFVILVSCICDYLQEGESEGFIDNMALVDGMKVAFFMLVVGLQERELPFKPFEGITLALTDVIISMRAVIDVSIILMFKIV